MRSLEELSDALARERGWRLKEISSVLKLSKSPNLGAIEREFYCRGGAALFYTHWEGFVKRSAKYYLTFIAFQRRKLNEMADFLIVQFVQQRIGALSESGRVLEVANLLLRHPDGAPKLSYKKGVDTESNLSSTVFAKILQILGIPLTNFETKLHAIDGKILKLRHPIAHGDKGDVGVDELREIGDLVIELCGTLKDEIENAALQKTYLRQ